jgi:hypothetical protein
MTYKEWVAAVPRVIRDDPVWRVEAYRLALFAGDLAWHDSTKLLSDKRTIGMADLLNRSTAEASSYFADLLHLLDNPPLPEMVISAHAPRPTHPVPES